MSRKSSSSEEDPGARPSASRFSKIKELSLFPSSRLPTMDASPSLRYFSQPAFNRDTSSTSRDGSQVLCECSHNTHDKKVLVVDKVLLTHLLKILAPSKSYTLDDLGTLFPNLDCVDFSRRKFDELNRLGIRQKIPDRLRPVFKYKRGSIQYPNLPLLVCNADMVWMAEKGE
ncbi:unnamed protein product, partial [Mesorhabditis belari]|uniref:Uncharacterized protein n=1 Tax=Mesorhabditis belari TaxID=2138241 RepID=A0AAF3JBS9_9BILA